LFFLLLVSLNKNVFQKTLTDAAITAGGE